jgi:oxygen-dependent protoporphyrinogen oxidase
VAIVGGGVAGLAAAHALKQRGLAFRLYEAGDRFGGVVRTVSEQGFLIEGGPDALLAQKPEALALCRELGLGDRIVPTNPRQRTVYVLRRGRLHALPEGMLLTVPTRVLPILRSGLFSWPGKLRMGLEALVPRRRAAGDESIGSFLRRRFGREMLERVGEPLLAGIHAGDVERLSMAAAFPRFVDLEARRGSLVRALRAAPPPAPPADLPTAFASLRGGLGELVDALVRSLPAEQLRPRSLVRSIRGTGSGYVLETEGDACSARAVILAVPAHAAAVLVRPVAEAAAAALRRIRFATTAVVGLGFRRADVAHPLDGYGLIVPRTEGLRTTACSFYSTKFEGRAPEGHVALRAFVGGMHDPDAASLADAELSALVRGEMREVLGLRGAPVFDRVFRWPDGTPQMEIGHADLVAAVERDLVSRPGLFVTGSGLRGTGIPDTVADGRRAAEAAAAHLARPA